MGLVASGFVSKQRLLFDVDLGGRDDDGTVGSKFYLELDPEFLEAYDLDFGDELKGTILEVGETRGDLIEELEDAEITFNVAGFRDRLFISVDSFATLRDWGLVKEGFWLKVHLASAIREGREVDIFPERDVVA